MHPFLNREGAGAIRQSHSRSHGANLKVQGGGLLWGRQEEEINSDFEQRLAVVTAERDKLEQALKETEKQVWGRGISADQSRKLEGCVTVVIHVYKMQQQTVKVVKMRIGTAGGRENVCIKQMLCRVAVRMQTGSTCDSSCEVKMMWTSNRECVYLRVCADMNFATGEKRISQSVPPGEMNLISFECSWSGG